jgi:hypothetical protein
MTIKRMFGTCAVAMVAAVSAGGAWFGGAGTALAPEEVELRETLRATGVTSVARGYVSKTPTNIVRWPDIATANSDGTPVAGQPCTTIWMPIGARTKQVIVADGPDRLCY